MSKALKVPAPQGESPITNPEKYAERLQKKTHEQMMGKIKLIDMMLKIVDDAEGDPRQETARAFHTAQRELIIAEIHRRKAQGWSPPPVKVGAETIILGSSVGQNA